MKYADIARAALVFALGIMTSAVLAQDPILQEGFEDISPATKLLDMTGIGWTGGSNDVSMVVAGTPDAPGIDYPLPLATHYNVLQLNTEGDTLTNTLASGVGIDFENNNVYVDSMVKFVPSYDLWEFDDDGIKVALYAYVSEDSVSTNLAIYHGGYDSEGYHFTRNTVTDLPVDVSAWYRLTILLANDPWKGELASQAAQIFINGVRIISDNAYAGAEWSDVSEEDLLAGPKNGTWFVSACKLLEKRNVVETLQFQGTGVLDDLVVSAGDLPFAPLEPPSFQVTQDIGANGSCSDISSPITVTGFGASTTLTYTAASFYRISSLTTNGIAVAGAVGEQSKTILFYSAAAVTARFARVEFQVTQNIGANGSCSDINSPITVGEGTSTTLTYTAASFYRIASLTTNGIAVAGAAGEKSKTIVIYSATDVNASFAMVESYSADNVSWFKENGWDENDVVEVPGYSYETLELLNVAPTNTAAGGTITIEDIEVVGNDVKVTVFIDRTMSLGATINGTLTLYGATTLESAFENLGSTPFGGDLDPTQDDIRKVYTYPSAGGKKFYKAVIEPTS